MIQQIKSRQNDKIKEVCKLENPAYCRQISKFKVDGFHLFELAKESGQLLEVYTLEEVKDLDALISQYIVTKEVMEKISSSKTPQGIVAVCKAKPSQPITNNKVLYLDDVSDPGNVGTIFRTALALGYNDIILSEKCCSPFSSKAIQSSQGAIFKLNIVRNVDLKELKKQSYKIIATELKGSIKLEEANPSKKHVLVLGNEAHGVSNSILEIADERVKIDINDIESLNVAVAGAIAMYAFSIKR